MLRLPSTYVRQNPVVRFTTDKEESAKRSERKTELRLCSKLGKSQVSKKIISLVSFHVINKVKGRVNFSTKMTKLIKK